MDKFVFLNGKFVASEDAHIHIYDHGFLYGDGAFEGIRVYHGKIFKLKAHIDRLYECLKALWIDLPYAQDVFCGHVEELVKMNEVIDGYIRPVVTRGNLLGLDPSRMGSAPTVMIASDKLALYPKSCYDDGLEVVTVATRLANPQVLEPRIKSIGKYVANIQAKLEANNVGAGEGLMLTEDGFVGECTGDNLFFIKKGVLHTPAGYLGILEGITRNTVIDLAKSMGIEVVEGVYTRYDLYTADEMFLTGTGAEVIPAVKLDGKPIADGKPGELTKKIIKAFHEYVRLVGAGD